MHNNTTPNLLQTGADELERLALEEVVKRRRFGNSVRALVIPTAAGDLAFAMAKLGCLVTVGDNGAAGEEFAKQVQATGFGNEISLAEFDFATPAEDLPGEPFDLIVVRRGICGIPYEPARHFVHNLLLRLKIGGKLYLSLLGLHSELGDGYPGNERPLNERFCELDPAMAEKYGIYRPICLYSERNLFTLMLEAGGSVLRTFTTTHGNVKGIAVRV